jgi:hypothetical protein
MDNGRTFVNEDDLELEIVSEIVKGGEGLPTWWKSLFGRHWESLVLTGHLTKGSAGSEGLEMPIDGDKSQYNLPWQRCGHKSGDGPGPAWWAVDLGAIQSVREVVLYNRNDSHAERLQGVELYLGNDWFNYSRNTKIAQGVHVGRYSPLALGVPSSVGQYLFVVKETAPLTLCEIEVVVEVVDGLREEVFYFPQSTSLPVFAGREADLERVVTSVDYPQTKLAWPGLKQVTMFAARWSGSIVVLTSGSYTFSLTSDDGSRLSISSALIADNDGDHALKTVEGKKEMAEGAQLILLEYFNRLSDPCMAFKYKGADTFDKLIVVPDHVLKAPDNPATREFDSHVDEGIAEEIFYFDQKDANPDLSGRLPDLTRKVSAVSYDYGEGASYQPGRLWPGLTKATNFAARWSMRVYFQKPGEYHFSLSSADGSMLYLDHERIVDNGGLHALDTVEGSKTITSKGVHRVRVEYFSKDNDAACTLKYKGEDTGDAWALMAKDTNFTNDADVTLRLSNLDYDKLMQNASLPVLLEEGLDGGIDDAFPLTSGAKVKLSKGELNGYVLATVRLTPPADVTNILWNHSLDILMSDGLLELSRHLEEIPGIWQAAVGNIEIEKFDVSDDTPSSAVTASSFLAAF